ncbi:MAG: ABC transporter ATP-binding protein [Pleomorphochaeta sp.]
MSLDESTIIQFDNVDKYYSLGKTKVHAVKNVSFTLTKGDFVSFSGPSGSGKSTILNMIGCIDSADNGSVIINNKTTEGLKEEEITKLRHETLGFIFQSFNLIPVLNIYENIEFPLLFGKQSDKEKAENKEWINYLIKTVGLEEWKDHKPNELSGGQRQRVAVARALVTKPAIVLADEPTANLDSVSSDNIIRLMKKMNKNLGTTFVFSTHDPAIVEIADHVITLKDGEIESNVRQQ